MPPASPTAPPRSKNAFFMSTRGAKLPSKECSRFSDHGESMVRPRIREPGDGHITIADCLDLQEGGVCEVHDWQNVPLLVQDRTLKTRRRLAHSSKARNKDSKSENTCEGSRTELRAVNPIMSAKRMVVSKTEQWHGQRVSNKIRCSVKRTHPGRHNLHKSAIGLAPMYCPSVL